MTKKFMALPYIPVSCEVYEILEEHAVRRRQCGILYLNDSGQMERIYDRITSLSAQDKVEYVHLAGGALIRLDALIELDGMALFANAYHQ
jgi:transcriptional antiterminator Rof (Rho-off)